MVIWNKKKKLNVTEILIINFGVVILFFCCKISLAILRLIDSSRPFEVNYIERPDDDWKVNY